MVDKVRQQHAEEGPGGIHDGAVHPGRVGQADIKEGVLEGGLGQSEDRELAKLRGGVSLPIGFRWARAKSSSNAPANRKRYPAKTTLEGISSVAI